MSQIPCSKCISSLNARALRALGVKDLEEIWADLELLCVSLGHVLLDD